MYKRRPITVTHFDIDDPDLLERFKKAADAERARTLKSKKTARAALVRAGILTKSGRLTKNYNR